MLLRSERHTRTRVVYLDRVTRVDAASDFFGELHVPRRAITMGIATILEVRAESALLRIISKAVCDPVCIVRLNRLEIRACGRSGLGLADIRWTSFCNVGPSLRHRWKGVMLG